MSETPLDQFKLTKLVNFEVSGYDISFTNSALFMASGILLVSVFLILALRQRKLVPGRMQSSAEILHDFILKTLNDNTFGKGEQYFPLIFSVFIFILTLNLLGGMPFGFAVTSHFSITFALAMIVFLAITTIAFIRHGFKFFSFFLPQDTPIFLAPLMIIIEIFTYLTRPVSLAIRLAANMTVGHILLFVIASFIVMMGYFGWVPIPFIMILSGFEFFVAVLQAYIFTILSCVYLNDAINLH